MIGIIVICIIIGIFTVSWLVMMMFQELMPKRLKRHVKTQTGPSKKQMRDYKWFVSNYDELFKQYGTCYLVVKDKKIIGTYKNYADAVKNTEICEPLGTFIVQYCDGTKEAYTSYVY